MLPAFEVLGLRCCATDFSGVSDDSYTDIETLVIASEARNSSPESGTACECGQKGCADIVLGEKQDYDRIIQEHPEAKLYYIDEDDGDTIEVGSSGELFARIEELQSQNRIIFDLQNRKGYPVWRRELLRSIHRRRQRQKLRESPPSITEAPVTVAVENVKGPLVDLTPEDAAPTVVENSQEKPFLAMFEHELSRLMGGASDLEAVGDAVAEGLKYTMCGAIPEVAPSTLPERASTPPIELPAETPEASSATEDSRHSHPLAQFIAGFPARNQQLFTSLRTSILTLAQTSASAARTAASLSRDLPVAEVQNSIETIRGLLDTAAREATAAASQAAECIDTSELQNFVGTVKNTVKEVGEAYQHVGQVVGGEVKRAVRDVVESTGMNGERVSKEESAKERKELERAIREFLGDVAEPDGRKEGSSETDKGKGKAVEVPPKRAAPPRPFVEEVPDEEAPGFARKGAAFFTHEENVVVPPPVPPKVEPEAADIPHVQSPSPMHTSTPPPVPKKTPIDVSDDERQNMIIHAPEHDDAGDSDSSDDDDDDLAAPTNFSPGASHTSRMHNFTAHTNSIPSSPFGAPHYLQPSYNPYITPCEAVMNERAAVIRGLKRARDVPNRGAESMRMFPRDDAFPMNGSNADPLRHRMTFPTFHPGLQPPPPPPHSTSPPRMTPMPHQPSPPHYMNRFAGDSHFCPLSEHGHGVMPSFITSQPPHPPPLLPQFAPQAPFAPQAQFAPQIPFAPQAPFATQAPFAPQPPYNNFILNYSAPLPPQASWMGDMGMFPRYVHAYGYQAPSLAEQAYKAAVKSALAGIPISTLQDRLQNPQLARSLWAEVDRVASEVPVPLGVVGWAGLSLDEKHRITMEASGLRERRLGEEGMDHRDVSLEEEDDEERNMNMSMENPFATPPRMESPAHMAHHSRPGSMQGPHLPTFPSSRPESAARMFPNFRLSPVPITPASPAPLHSPFVRRDSPFVTRGHIRKQSLGSSRSTGMSNCMYQHMSFPAAAPSDHASARRSTPAIPIGSYSQSSAPAVPVDHRHMPSAPAVPGNDNDAFEMLSPLLPHLQPHRPVLNPSLHNLHRGTPPVPDVPEEDNTNDEGSRQPQSPFISHGHHNYSPPFPPRGFARNTPPPPTPLQHAQPPVPPVHRDLWDATPISPLIRGPPRANTFPGTYQTQQSHQVPQPSLPGSFSNHFGNYRSTTEEMGMGSRNPFFQSEDMGLRGMQGIVHRHVPPAPFWPADVDDDDDDDEEEDQFHRGRAMGRQYSILTDDDDGFSFRSEEDRRGRSPTARGPRAQPGNYTPPGPPRFKLDQHFRDLAGEKVIGEEKKEEKEKEEQKGVDDEMVQDVAEVRQEEFIEEPQPREQHEPSVPNTPTQQTYRKPGEFESQFDFLDHLERGVESFVLPQALPPPPPPHAEISVFAAAEVAVELGVERGEAVNPPSSSRRHPRNSPLPDPPAPFTYPPPPSRTPTLVLRPLRINRDSQASSSSTDNNTQTRPETHGQVTSETQSQSTPAPNDLYLLESFAGPSSGETSNAALSLLPPHMSRRSSLDSRIDECMAALIELGYADDADGDSALDKLRVYARHADGDVCTAIELLAEDGGAWEEREKEEARAVGENSQGEGWRFAGWY